MSPSHKFSAVAAALFLCFSLLLSGCGEENSPAEALPQTGMPNTQVSYPDVSVSEFMAKNRAVLRDEDGDFSDWIELYNSGSEEADLTGWSLSDDEEAGWVFPACTIPAGKRLIVFASGKDHADTELHTDFSLKDGEGVWLRAPDGTVISQAPGAACRSDESFAFINGSWQVTLYPTPGEENSPEGYSAFQQKLSPQGPLVINEVQVSNMSFLSMGKAGYADWLEVRNVSGGDLLLSDFFISDDADEPDLYRLPDCVLSAGQALTLVCGDKPADYSSSRFPWFTGFSLDSSNEQLYLTDSAGVLIDYASLRDIPRGCSYGRMDGEAGWFFFEQPTPGGENAGGKRCVASPPEALTQDGVFNGVDSVLVSLGGAGDIYYTLDGSMPTSESTPYTGPIELTATGVVRSVLVREDAICSRPLTQTFILNENHTLPVFCLNTDDPSAFKRMYDGRQKHIELPASLSMYREDGSFTIGCGVSLNGETSLSEIKKNMAVRFRGAYGQETLNYDIYGGGVTEFTNLLLRSGQDYQHAIIRNELAQNLCAAADCHVINQRSIYGILYINGEYWGIYTLKEKANEQLYASLAGVSRSSVQLYEAPASYDTDFYNEVVRFCQNNDMTLPENYARFCEVMDVDNLIDWLIMQGFCANTDLVSGNLRYCRSPEADGKWHLMFYDLDAAFLNERSIFYNFMTDFGSSRIQFSSFVVPLMQNEEFRDSFLTRAAELLAGPLSNEAVLAEIDRLHDEIVSEVPRDYGRFTMQAESWEWNLESMRDMVSRRNWRQLNIDALSFVFDLSDEERAAYFGKIDGK